MENYPTSLPPQAQDQQHEECDHLAACAQHGALILTLLPLVVMPLDGVEHPRAQHEKLEYNENYRDPVDHFAYSRLLLANIYREELYLKRCLSSYIVVQTIEANCLSILDINIACH